MLGTWGKFIKSSVRAAIDFATINVAVRYSPAGREKQQGPTAKAFVGAISSEPVALEDSMGYLMSHASGLSPLKKEIRERALKEVSAKSSLIRETAIGVESKKNSFHTVSMALDELFTFLNI